ncbi:MAG: sulfate ABC transporter substrate-binding protein [Bryobacterales bacterium]|nr:sulfate ABC transporter substrate-binding protein [Bryobacterales bacterium]
MAGSPLSRRTLLGTATIAALASAGCGRSGLQSQALLNVSYDPTRELFEGVNRKFADFWRAQGKAEIAIDQSHGGSAKQARSVLDGLRADIVTLALAYDIDAIAERAKLLPADWQKRLPHNSCPFSSTVLFVVRAGNPKGIRDWPDLVRGDVAVITPNPKTSGGARWNYLAAWGYADRAASGETGAAFEFVRRLYRNAPLLDSGARAATTTFVQRKMGDVLISWEAEAQLALRQFPAERFEIVHPPLSILAEAPVAMVDEVAKRNGNLEAAQAYLEFLYRPEAQAVAATHHFRPSDPTVAKAFRGHFPAFEMLRVDEAFGGWATAHKRHFADGGTFDQIYQTGPIEKAMEPARS